VPLTVRKQCQLNRAFTAFAYAKYTAYALQAARHH